MDDNDDEKSRSFYHLLLYPLIALLFLLLSLNIRSSASYSYSYHSNFSGYCPVRQATQWPIFFGSFSLIEYVTALFRPPTDKYTKLSAPMDP